MTKYLVTGGAGFVGSHLVQRLVARQQVVVVVDNLSTGRLENLEPLLPQVRFIEGDLADPSVAGQAVEGVDYVLHQAALPSVPRSLADPLATDHHNTRATLQLLVAARQAGVRRVVQASSSSVFGDTPTLPKTESMKLAPRSPYAASKAAGELYGQAFVESFALEYVALRYFNVFGPRQDPLSTYAAVIPRFIAAYQQRQRPVVHGDGRQSRDFCFIDNVVEANLLACQAPQASGQVFNIACGQRVELLRVLELLAQHFGYRLDPEFQARRPGDVRHSQADITAARRVLGYEPSVHFEEGLRRTIRWFEEN